MIENRKIRHEYHILHRWNAGIVLLGTEVKSLRSGSGSLDHAYAFIENNEVFLASMNIPIYKFSAELHQPQRKRKLLLRKKEIKKMIRSKDEKHTLVPEKVYFDERGYVKVSIALCEGKKQFDKRRAIKEKENAIRLFRLRKSLL